ncbi:MAG: hypothetical protein ACRC1D_07290 [Culicoidibacterales bacterium]
MILDKETNDAINELPAHLQDHFRRYEEKHLKFFGETSEQAVKKLRKIMETADENHPVHGLARF